MGCPTDHEGDAPSASKAALALDFTGAGVGVFVRADAGPDWVELGRAGLEGAGFAARIGDLKAKADARGLADEPAVLWLPEEQISALTLDADDPLLKDPRSALDKIGEAIGRSSDALVLAISPVDAKGKATVLAALKETWSEAQDYAADWGFRLGPVSTRHCAERFGSEGPVLAPPVEADKTPQPAAGADELGETALPGPERAPPPADAAGQASPPSARGQSDARQTPLSPLKPSRSSPDAPAKPAQPATRWTASHVLVLACILGAAALGWVGWQLTGGGPGEPVRDTAKLDVLAPPAESDTGSVAGAELASPPDQVPRAARRGEAQHQPARPAGPLAAVSNAVSNAVPEPAFGGSPASVQRPNASAHPPALPAALAKRVSARSPERGASVPPPAAEVPVSPRSPGNHGWARPPQTGPIPTADAAPVVSQAGLARTAWLSPAALSHEAAPLPAPAFDFLRGFGLDTAPPLLAPQPIPTERSLPFGGAPHAPPRLELPGRPFPPALAPSGRQRRAGADGSAAPPQPTPTAPVRVAGSAETGSSPEEPAGGLSSALAHAPEEVPRQLVAELSADAPKAWFKAAGSQLALAKEPEPEPIAQEGGGPAKPARPERPLLAARADPGQGRAAQDGGPATGDAGPPAAADPQPPSESETGIGAELAVTPLPPRPPAVLRAGADDLGAPPDAATSDAAEETAALADVPLPPVRPSALQDDGPSASETALLAGASASAPQPATISPVFRTPQPPERPSDLSVTARAGAALPSLKRVLRPPTQSVRLAARDRGLALDRTSLIGVLEVDGGRAALVRTADGRVRRLARGDRLEGWVVRLIGRDAMRLEQAGQSRTLLLVGR